MVPDSKPRESTTETILVLRSKTIPSEVEGCILRPFDKLTVVSPVEPQAQDRSAAQNER